jgi:hypothetical protein
VAFSEVFSSLGDLSGVVVIAHLVEVSFSSRLNIFDCDVLLVESVVLCEVSDVDQDLLLELDDGVSSLKLVEEVIGVVVHRL